MSINWLQTYILEQELFIDKHSEERVKGMCH